MTAKNKQAVRRAVAAKYLTPELKARMKKAIEEEERPEVIAANIAKGRALLAQKRAATSAVPAVVGSLQAERERLNLSLADLSERTGIDRSNLQKLLSDGATNPTMHTLERVAAAVGKRLVVVLEDAKRKPARR